MTKQTAKKVTLEMKQYKISELGCPKSDEADPGQARIMISVLSLFGQVFCLFCLSSCFEQSQTTKAVGKNYNKN